MCGIAGALSRDGTALRVERLKPMVDAIAHRGPDDAGYLVWQRRREGRHGEPFGQAFSDERYRHISPLLPVIDSAPGATRLTAEPWDVFLGHRRLAILDLSPRGHQPMPNRAGTVWISYNGEVYNFGELRQELERAGHSFSSRTDTEVLLCAYEEWGIDFVRRLNGMFAFALWDARVGRLHLARDRYGVKPLYVWDDGRTALFASEVKSILAYLGGRPEVDLLALNEYLSFQNTFSGRTLFDGVRLMPPGTIRTIDPERGTTTEARYWDFDFSTEATETREELEEELYRLIQQAIRRQCVSDVPIGAYLSGGMDSGTVASVTRSALGRIFTFTAGFDLSEAAQHELRYDEREPAERMAALLQTEHYECVLHAGDIEAVMQPLITHLEDLRVGQSYPNYYIARLAGKFVKVVMSGAGGDELFGGYPWRYAAAIGASGDDFVRNYYRYWKRLVSDEDKPRLYNAATVGRLRAMSDEGAVPFEDHTLSVFRRVFGQGRIASSAAEQVNASLYFECKTFLQGILLVEDKLSMAHSLETRVPFLDNDLVDFACRLPVRFKVSGLDTLQALDENLPRKKRYYEEQIGQGKLILRSAMERLLPPAVTDARKQGFSAPDESWFRGRSEAYVRARLLRPDARVNELLNPEYVAGAVERHCSGRQNNRLLIWSFLCLETWLSAFRP